MEKIGENKSCLIMMATYNGEAFIDEQIRSIINQTHVNWNLWIRDDGSTDDTINIVLDFCKKDKRIKLIKNDTDVHGAYNNFHELIILAKEDANFDYYAFSDQDDIWRKEKIEVMINFMEIKNEPDIPCFVYSDLTMVDNDKNILTDSVNEIMGINLINKKNLFFAHSFVWGCASMFNKKLLVLIPCIDENNKYRSILSHDNYLAKYAITFGNIFYVDNQLILYRKHLDSVTSGQTVKFSFLQIVSKVLFELKKVSKTNTLVYIQTLIFIEVCKNNGLHSYLLDEVFDTIKRGGIYGISKLFHMKIRRKQLIRTLGTYTIMLLKTYKTKKLLEITKRF
ncbi:glycosyltransferase family 2 protein [Liquorilactobacillus mali]|uniref:glycosyltransferase family 2 protein n=1 Tax=Liquorilactobacillus mali TaxID=1618 RepID=UPI0026551BCC|nr:glycosyltransferase family 2 protein [Liquorilactobacillus mali]MDN7145077.1 glycosyltransferase family 2 protein [Liquorilactobacillus mali]